MHTRILQRYPDDIYLAFALVRLLLQGFGKMFRDLDVDLLFHLS